MAQIAWDTKCYNLDQSCSSSDADDSSSVISASDIGEMWRQEDLSIGSAPAPASGNIGDVPPSTATRWSVEDFLNVPNPDIYLSGSHSHNQGIADADADADADDSD